MRFEADFNTVVPGADEQALFTAALFELVVSVTSASRTTVAVGELQADEIIWGNLECVVRLASAADVTTLANAANQGAAITFGGQGYPMRSNINIIGLLLPLTHLHSFSCMLLQARPPATQLVCRPYVMLRFYSNVVVAGACSLRCESCCSKNYTCPTASCARGYSGFNCQQRCPPNHFGPTCTDTCSSSFLLKLHHEDLQ